MTWLRGRLYAILLAMKAALLALVYLKGRRDAKARKEAEAMEDYRETRERIDQVVRDHDQSDAVDWLRDRGRK